VIEKKGIKVLNYGGLAALYPRIEPGAEDDDSGFLVIKAIMRKI
jgi:hypothetical protein